MRRLDVLAYVFVAVIGMFRAEYLGLPSRARH